MEYYNGFVFYLDENNPKWKEYYNNLGKKTFGVYSVAQYFTKKLKELADDKLDKVFNINYLIIVYIYQKRLFRIGKIYIVIYFSKVTFVLLLFLDTCGKELLRQVIRL